MAGKFNECLNPDIIDGLARETGFSKRKSKLKPHQFFESLMFSRHSGKSFSLTDLCADLMEEYGLEITKQAVDDRFNDRAVLFFHRILDRLLSAEFNPPNDSGGLLSRFNRVRIKDSTKFPLPKVFAHKYGGNGGGGNGGGSDNCESLISIQYEYDLLSGETLDLRLTDGLKTTSRIPGILRVTSGRTTCSSGTLAIPPFPTLRKSVKKGLFSSTDFPPGRRYMPPKMSVGANANLWISGNYTAGSVNTNYPTWNWKCSWAKKPCFPAGL